MLKTVLIVTGAAVAGAYATHVLQNQQWYLNLSHRAESVGGNTVQSRELVDGAVAALPAAALVAIGLKYL